MSKIGLLSAYLDESVITSPERPGTYLMCAVVVADADSDMCRTSMMTCLLPGRSYLHHRDEQPNRRVHIAAEIARLPIIGIIIQHAELIAPKKQEAVRARILATLLPRLEHTEGAGAAVLESRGGGDRHDRRTVSNLRDSRRLTSLEIQHRKKSEEPLTWVADFAAGAYAADFSGRDVKLWRLLDDQAVIDVCSTPG